MSKSRICDISGTNWIREGEGGKERERIDCHEEYIRTLLLRNVARHNLVAGSLQEVLGSNV